MFCLAERRTRLLASGCSRADWLDEKEVGMNLNGILIGSDDPKRLTAYYTRLFGEPGWSGGDFVGWQLGGGYVTVGPHDRVQGPNPLVSPFPG